MDVDMSDPRSPPASNANAGILTSLSEPLRSYALTAFPPDDDGDDKAGDNRQQDDTQQDDDKSKSIALRRLDVLEISLRSHALGLVEDLMRHADGSTEFHTSLETLLHFLKDVTLFTVDLVQLAAASNDDERSKLPKSYANATSHIFHRLPITLLSDIIAALPISAVQLLWSSLPNLSPFHPRSGYVSHLCHPSTFKAFNKMLLLRICNHLLKCCSNRDVDAEFAGSVMITLAHVFPLSERSAMNVLGSFNVDNVTGWEGEDEFQRGRKLRGVAVAGDGGGNSEESMDVDQDTVGGAAAEAGDPLGYDFYSTFWGVQKVFTDPPGTILSPNGGFEAFENFVKHMKTILAAFESTPAIASSTSKIPTISEEVTHYKYLTSSQLLHLQLKDPEIRTQFLTQFIILLSHLNSSSVTLPTPPISTTPGANPSKLNAQLKQTQMNQLTELEKRTQQLLKSIKPNGESHLRAVCWILKERESMWRNWKKNKCFPPLEKVPVNGAKIITSHDIRTILTGKKRKASDIASRTNGIIGINTNLPDIMSTIKKSLPTLDTFLEPYVEALDPEAEVDAEYHPGNDKVYCWRALRLLAHSQEGEGQLRRFVHLRRKDGSFEGIVRRMWKEDKGEEIPGSYIEMDDKEFQFKANQEEKSTGDAEMDDVSVGTPEVDEAAKIEKMSEFEKAAMEMEEEMLNEPEDTVMDNGELEKICAIDDSMKEMDKKDGRNGEMAKQDARDTTVDVNSDKATKENAVDAVGDENADKEATEADKIVLSNTKGGVNADVTSDEAAAPDIKCEESTVKDSKEAAPHDEPAKVSKPASNEKRVTESKSSEDSSAIKDNAFKREPTPPVVSVSKTAILSDHEKSISSTNHDSGGKDRDTSTCTEPKPKEQQIKPTAKFIPRDQIRQKQQQNKNDQSEARQKPHQDHTKDHPSGAAGSDVVAGSGSGRESSGVQDRRASDARRGPPHQQYHQRGGRYGNKEESLSPVERSHESSGTGGGNDTRDKRGDRYHNAPSQGGGRGSAWQPPSHGGRGGGGRQGNRGNSRDDRRGGRGRR